MTPKEQVTDTLKEEASAHLFDRAMQEGLHHKSCVPEACVCAINDLIHIVLLPYIDKARTQLLHELLNEGPEDKERVLAEKYGDLANEYEHWKKGFNQSSQLWRELIKNKL